MDSKTPFIQISRIGFTSVREILPIFQLLRQSIIFNHLVDSVATFKGVKVINWYPPEKIQLFFVTKSMVRVQMEFSIVLIGLLLQVKLCQVRNGKMEESNISLPNLKTLLDCYDVRSIISAIKEG